jgi:hypothetical protein
MGSYSLEGPNTEGDDFPIVVPAHVGARIRGDVDDPFAPCPACGQKKRKPRTESREAARPKVRVRIDVPKDNLEDGFAIFHSLLEECADELGRSKTTPPYFTLVEVMHFFLTSTKQKQTT